MHDNEKNPNLAPFDDDAPPAAPDRVDIPQFFDFELHERVQALQKKGIWSNLGPQFGGLHQRLRPFHDHSVVVKREAAETAVRARLGKGEKEELPADELININRAAVIMAITGARGNIAPSSTKPITDQGLELRSTLEIAKEHRFQMEQVGGGGRWVVMFTGEEEPAKVRDFFASMLYVSMPLLNRLVNFSQNLQRVKDEEIDRLGEDFVYGEHTVLDWHDSGGRTAAPTTT